MYTIYDDVEKMRQFMNTINIRFGLVITVDIMMFDKGYINGFNHMKCQIG